jgi:transposase
MSPHSVVGIDVAKAQLVVCLRSPKGKYYRQTFPNNQAGLGALQQWLVKHAVQTAHICLEATGMYGEEAAAFLHAAGYTVSVVNPLQVKAFMQAKLNRNKTDARDADLIADFCRVMEPLPWTPPDPAFRTLRDLMRRLDDLKHMHQQEVNRAAAGLRNPLVLDNLQANVAAYAHQIQAFEAHIRAHVQAHPELKRQHDLLTSIKGIGDFSANLLLAEIRFEVFSDVRQVVAFVGLNPRQHQSGSSIRLPARISKLGNAALRGGLYWAAVSAKNHNPLILPLCQRMAANGHGNPSQIMAAMRKLLHLAFGVLHSGQPFDPHYLTKLPLPT